MRHIKAKITPLILDLPEQASQAQAHHPQSERLHTPRAAKQGPGGLSSGVDLGLSEMGKSGDLGRLNGPR
jgi:hypothetical protein